MVARKAFCQCPKTGNVNTALMFDCWFLQYYLSAALGFCLELVQVGRANNRKSSGEQVRLESDIETLRTVRMEIRSCLTRYCGDDIRSGKGVT